MKDYLFIIAAGLFDKGNLPEVAANQETLTKILFIVFSIIGALAFLLFVIAGFRYVMAQGDPQRVASAKNQLIYTAIGLVLAGSAAAIVNFVLSRA
jgi:hypothetical protein